MRPTKRRKTSPAAFDSQEASLEDASTESLSSNGSSASDIENVTVDAAKDRHSVVTNRGADVSSNIRRPGRSSQKSKNTREPTLQLDAFQLQIRELIRTLTPKYTIIETLLADILSNVRDAISNATSVDPCSVAQAEKILSKSHRVAVPFPEPRPASDINYKFAYVKPVKVELHGDFAYRTTVGDEEGLDVDLAVQMPESIFDRKDYQDYRYFHKRAFYLARLATALYEGIGASATLRYELYHDNPLLPILSIEPTGGPDGSKFAQARCKLRIVPHVDGSIFPPDKVRPSSSCIRSLKPSPTPFYNASMVCDVTLDAHRTLFNIISESCPGFREACMLGNVWLRQRGLGSSVMKGGFGSVEWSAVVAWLLNEALCGRKAAFIPSSGGFQLFKATLQMLGLRDLVTSPLSIGRNENYLASLNGIPVLYNADLNLNLLYKMSPWSYSQLRRDARATLSQLQKPAADNFDTCFIYNVASPYLRSDYIVDLSAQTLRASKMTEATDEPNVLHNAKNLHNVLRQGLSDRVKDLNVQLPSFGRAELHADRLIMDKNAKVIIHVDIEPSAVLRRIDRGPSAEESEKAADFRTFWGERVELRRFNDGSICETIAWKSQTAHSLLYEMISYLIRTHFGASASKSLTIRGNNLQGILENHEPNLSAFDPVMASFESLENDIRALEDLPLQIRQIRPACPELSFTSVQVPLRSSQASQHPPDVTVQFEGSARWPDDLTAIQMTKIAFLLRMSDAFRQVHSVRSARIGLENEHSEVLNKAFLEVEYTNGSAFHLRIHHDREQTLIERQLKDRTASPRERETAAAALASYKRTFECRPAHISALQVLARRCPAFSSAARLLKAWLSAHLLQSHIAQELTDVLVARVFVHPYPWPTPTTATTGFLRALLFLSKWDWQHEPLIVDFAGNMSIESLRALNTRFDAWRKLDPAMNRIVMFVATNYDTDGSTWTEFAPSKVIAGRITSLARAAVTLALRDGLGLDMERLFKPSLKDYDFVLHLKPRYLNGSSRSKNAKQQQTSNEQHFFFEEDTTTDFLQELTSIYAEAALFFAHSARTNVIGGLWTPNTTSRSWKPSLAFSTIPSAPQNEGQTRTALNRPAMLAEMARLGGDLVVSVTSKG